MAWDSVIVLDASGVITRFNSSAERVTGYCSDAFLGRHWSEAAAALLVGYGHDSESAEAYWETLLVRGEPRSGEVRIRTRSGDHRLMLFILTPLVTASRNPLGLLALGQDVTARSRQAEQSLRRDRISALGAMCSRVSHDLRNPLSAVILNAQMLEQFIREGSAGWLHLRDILVGAQRIEANLDRLSALSRPAVPQKRAFHVYEVAENALQGIRARAHESAIRIHVHHEEGIPQAFGDPSQIQQALLNLFLNSLEALPRGGDLSFRCNRAPAEEQEDGDPFPWIELHVEDTGCGIPQEEQTKVFDPFYTTKPGRTGLGLTTAHCLVDQNRGSIHIESTPGKGTRFTLRMPSVPAEHAEE